MENYSQKFKKHSRTGSILSGLGILVIFLSVVLFIYFDRVKQNKITLSNSELIKKEALTIKLNDSLKVVKKIIHEDKVVCNAKALNQKLPDGKSAYLFTLKIKDPILATKLTSVDYFFDHPSFNPKLKTSRDSKHNFKLSYEGWGCLEKIYVYLHYKSSPRTDTIIFPMCDKTQIELIHQ